MASEYGGDADGGVAAEVAQRYGRSAQPESQQVVAVFKAITDVIRTEGLPLSPTSYFAAIMSALEKPETQTSQQVVLAMLTLLSLVLPRLPAHVLRSRFAGAAELVGALLAAHGAEAATAKAALGCLAQVLAAADPAAWLAAVPAFNQLLTFLTDARPKVRKRASGGLVEVLAGLQRSAALGAASELVLKACQRILPGPAAAAQAAASASNKQRAAAEAAITAAVADALHLLGALKGGLPLLATQAAKAATELLLKLYSLRQPLLDRHVTEALAALAGAQGAAAAGSSSGSGLAPSDLGDLLTVVTDTESLWVGGGRDPGLLMALGRLLEGGFSRLAEVDPAACAARLPRAVHALVPQLAAEQDGVRYGTSQALRTLITDCLTADTVAAARRARPTGPSSSGPTPLASLVAAVASTLSARYQDAWGMALPVVGTLIEKLGEVGAADVAGPLLVPLGAICAGALDAVEDADAAGAGAGGEEEEGGAAGKAAAAAHAGAAEATLGTALRALGPEAVLKVLPLQILEGLAGTAEPRTWLLPLMRRHVRHSQLGFWFRELLPLAQSLGGRAAALSAAGGAAAGALALKCRALELQVWHCLPAFISWATDLPTAYPAAVNSLAAAFANRPDLHPPICMALQRAAAQVRHVLAADGRGSEFIGFADPAAHGPTSGAAAAAGGTAGADDDDDDGAAAAGMAEDPAVAAAHGGAPPSGYDTAAAEAALTALRSYNKQWLSVLCKAYLVSEPEGRLPYSAAIAAVSAVTEAGVVGGYFRSAMQKLQKVVLDESAEVPPPDLITDGGPDPAARRNAFLELALWLSFGLPEGAVDALFRSVKGALTHSQAAVQKRGFKVLAVLAEARGSWLAGNLGEVIKQLLGPQATATLSAARRYRLRVIRPVIIALQQLDPKSAAAQLPRDLLGGDEEMADGKDADDDDEEGEDGKGKRHQAAFRRQLVASLVADIVLCTKESNKKTRAAAYDLLVGLAHVMDEQEPGQLGGSEEEEEDMGQEKEAAGCKGGLYEFFSMVMAGLVATTPHMVSATVMALARLTYEFAAAMQNVIASLVPPVLSLLRGKAREVVKSVLGFVKVCAMRLPVDLLTPQLGPILEGILLWSQDSKNKFKLKVRVIVERLARRCGFEALASVMPPSESRLLAHIRKEAAKKQRRKAGSQAGSEAGDVEGDRRSRHSSGRDSLARTARASQWGHTAVFSSEAGDDMEEDEQELAGGAGRRGAGGAKSVKSAGGKSAGGRNASGGVRLAAGGSGGDPMDLLDAATSRQLVRSAAGVVRQPAAGREEAFKRDPSSGKMVIAEEEDDDPLGLGKRGGNKKRRRGDDDGYNSDDSDYDDLKGVADLRHALRKAGESKSVRFAEAAAAKSEGGRSMGGRSAGGRSAGGASSVGGRSAGGRSSGGGKGAHSGERFKAKGAAGDVKGKSKIEPYAYWSLDRRMLNRRRGKQAAATSKLESIVSGAKAGALKGAKAKRQAAASAAAAGGRGGGRAGGKGGAKRQRTSE
ncbi:hypothetical protein Agub_g14918 [Astrephomene gubernaculifera]|uniref:Ribosomal RNA-processing protein 12-like conserved domain-containing protein n=1 Tax=Astrephomene gubernaculifera TaxID=47775 RepID=A0AAD3E284_9CHLO|nr:hypothetical protein Agub_g14918 [Astrephomene gubernaculifera]